MPLVKTAGARAFESMQLLHIAAKVRAHHILDIDAVLRSRWRALEIYVALSGQSEEEMFALSLHEEHYKIVDENSFVPLVVEIEEYPCDANDADASEIRWRRGQHK